MRVLVAGGTGFVGRAVSAALRAAGHEPWVLTRQQARSEGEVQWDGRSLGPWTERLNEVDAVLHATGYGLEHWPWSAHNKKRFLASRVEPGRALAQGILQARRRPGTLIQISGINYYGARGEGVADESTPPADDFLAQVTVKWEEATRPVENAGVRRVIARTAVILDRRGGLFPLMALPVRLGFGGPLGNGRQVVPWIHVQDHARALVYLLENPEARGPFNLIAPQVTTNAQFMRAVAGALHRPYWFPTPGFLLRLVLGEMSTLVLDGRASAPRRLEQLGFQFRYPDIATALGNLFGARGVSS